MAQSPLFDIYGDDIDPIGIVPLRTRRTLADLMPEEEKTSLLRDLANQGSSGLSAVGYLLDTPGAFVRGVLAGDPLSVFGTSEDRVTGRELLRQYGLVGKNDTWGNFAGGLGAEVLLDPLTYASFGLSALLGTGAKTAAAKAATRAGLMGTAGDDLVLRAARAAESGAVPNFGPATFLRNSTPETLAIDNATEAARRAGQGIDDAALRSMAEDAAHQETLQAARRAFEQVGGTAEQWTQPLTRSNYVKVPYLVDDAFDMYGSTVGDYLARGSDWLKTNARATPVLGPALRAAQAMFDARVKGFTDEPGQMFGRKVTRAEQLSSREANRRLADMHQQLFDDVSAYLQNNANAIAGTPLAGRSGEDIVRSQDFARAFGNVMENQLEQLPPEMRSLFRDPGVQRAVRFATDAQADALARAERLGVPLRHKDLPNGIDYFTRQAIDIPNARFDPRFQGSKVIPLRDRAVASINDGTRSSRRGYTEAFPRWVLDKMYQDADLQAALRNAPNTEARNLIDEWLAANADQFKPIREGSTPFGYMGEHLNPDDFSEEGIAAAAEVSRRQQKAYEDLADSLRRTPLQRASEGIPLYGNALNDLTHYIRHNARREATADLLLDELSSNALLQSADDVAGGVSYTPMEALRELGFMAKSEGDAGVLALANRMGITPEELLGGRSFSREMVDRMNENLVRARAPREATGLFALADKYTQSFKTLALLWPARYVRDMYSGAFAGATQSGFNLFDALAGVRARGGDYGPLARRLESAPGYQVDDLFPVGAAPSAEQLSAARVRKFLTEAGGEGLTSGTVSDDLGRMGSNLTYAETFPGGSGAILQGMGARIRNRPLPLNIFSLRTSEGNPNWLLELGDRAAEGSDAFNRIGTYLTRVRKGDAPAAAKAVADLTQINYRPEAFSSFERDILKRIVPFYSYQKGITPLVAQELLYNPSGITGQSIRAINRASAPSEDRFTPEYLRQSAAIPIDSSVPLLGVNTPGITRVLTNLDLPHEGLINLLTPGVGNTLTGQFLDAVTKTGQNLLGQTNPLIKAPLEVATNRQFYSGRQLSDLYSLAEQMNLPGGRLWDQVAFNAPGGSRVVGAIRQAMDSRISPQERAAKFFFNMLTGLKLQDVDQERTVRLAARTTLNQLLDQAKGMSSYENLFIKPEDLVKLSPQEQRQYLLYRILQSEAAKKARERKKMQDDPLSIMGV